MGKINQPSSQIRLTNVSLVRMKKGKKRFEIACYQNKVQDWRSGVEKDLDEVLQIHQVFLNVSKGFVAPSDLLEKSFGTTDLDKIILEILKKGELQLSGKERSQQIGKLHNEALTIISMKCVNPKTKKRYPPTMIDKALKELKFNMTNARSAKAKALEAIRLLVEKQIFPIARTQMKVRITIQNKAYVKEEKELKETLIAEVESEDKIEGDVEIVCLIEPEHYKQLAEKAKNMKGSVEVLDMAVIDDNNSSFN
ncbi:DEKNAAC102287 [Brettanomyces naardenensis]|uniref:Ribosome maturation protein SDO1 n=1 Tax=Brettanomyces naardenensis TaxID=13370 RepID=A0A448YKF7_BRENA|nr:DEKNAAC102287 [Brettanomyces naardenensis]